VRHHRPRLSPPARPRGTASWDEGKKEKKEKKGRERPTLLLRVRELPYGESITAGSWVGKEGEEGRREGRREKKAGRISLFLTRREPRIRRDLWRLAFGVLSSSFATRGEWEEGEEGGERKGKVRVSVRIPSSARRRCSSSTHRWSGRVVRQRPQSRAHWVRFKEKNKENWKKKKKH